jgi:hypothetical protein
MASVPYLDVQIRRGVANIYDFLNVAVGGGSPITLDSKDASSDLQRILNALGPGGVLRIPPRDDGDAWRLANIGIGLNQTIRGEGTIISPPLGVAGPIFQIGLTDPLGAVTPSTNSLWHLTGFILNGDKESQPVSKGLKPLNQGVKIVGSMDGVAVNDASPIALPAGSTMDLRNRVSFCEIANMTGDALVVFGLGANDFTNIRIISCDGVGILVNSPNNNFENIDIGACGSTGLLVHAPNGNGNGFSNMKSWGNGNGSAGFQNVKISNSTLDDLANLYFRTAASSLGDDSIRLLEYKWINGEPFFKAPHPNGSNGGPYTQEFEGHDYDIRGDANLFMGMRGQDAYSHSMVLSGSRNVWWGALTQDGYHPRRWYQHKAFLALDASRGGCAFNEVHLNLIDTSNANADFLVTVLGTAVPSNNKIYINAPADTSTNTGGLGPPASVTGGIVPGSNTSSPVTASKFTGSISGTKLTVTAWTAGLILPGQTLSGTGVAADTAIVSQTSGTTGKNGVYQVNVSKNVASTTLTGTAGLLTLSSGGVQEAQILTGAAAGTVVMDVAGGSTYAVSPSQTVASGTAMATQTAVTGVNANGYAQTTITLTGQPANGDWVKVDGGAGSTVRTYTFKTALAAADDVLIGGNATQTATYLAEALVGQASTFNTHHKASTRNAFISSASAATAGSNQVVTVVAATPGPGGTTIPFVEASAALTRSGVLAGYSTGASASTLIFTSQPADGDMLTLGSVAYVFRTAFSVDGAGKVTTAGEIKIQASTAATAQALYDAINQTSGTGVAVGSGPGSATYVRAGQNSQAAATAQATSYGTERISLEPRQPGLGGSGVVITRSGAKISEVPPFGGTLDFRRDEVRYSPSAGAGDLGAKAAKNSLYVNAVKLFGP